ncbi:MAG TPA: UPF0182 family protein, partial [Terriglobales bacterium]|nr:UPF0182 family protein [Terriglobales bacterium]
MNRSLGLLLFAVLLLLFFFGEIISLYTDWLWFQAVGFSQVFTTILTYKTLLAAIFGGLFGLLIYMNVRFATREPVTLLAQEESEINLPSVDLVDPMIKQWLLPLAVILGFFAATQAAAHWNSFLLFFNGVPFELKDPLFNRDIGFYIFRLPALTALYNWLSVCLGLTFLATALSYFLYRGIRYSPQALSLSKQARTHLFLLVGAILLVKAGGYYLDRFELLYSPRGAAFGASYADVYGSLPVLRFLVVVATAAAGLSLVQIYRPGFKYLLTGLGLLLLVHFFGLNVYPSLLQRFRVVPNEVVAERPFIERNIEFTRKA